MKRSEVRSSSGSEAKETPAERPRRVYKKRSLKPEQGHVGHGDDFQFCPRCGLNLFVLLHAMAAASKFSRSIGS